jgi:putative tryptophan/tyrosine transport system substrate-binding protein
MTRRRAALAATFVLGLFTGGFSSPLTATAQPAGKVPRIGILSPTAPSEARSPSDLAVLFAAFRQGLRDLGYVEGRNITIESRWAEGNYERLPGLAADLVRLKVNVIVTYGTPASEAAKRATSTIPIVMAAIIDPVASGLVTSLARPGGNVTGQSMMSPDLVEKQLEILKEVVPKVSRVALLHNPANPGNAPQVKHAQDAARALGVRLQLLGARDPGEIDSAFAVMTGEQAVIVLVDATLQGNRARITDLAARHRLPAVYGLSEYAEVGGLLTYGPNRLDMFRHAGVYVDKILKGAKPGDLPVEQPTKFELVINLKTAKALGLTIPPSLLVRADQVIE